MGQMYLITFKTSGKSYVGISSKSAVFRWKQHIHPKNNSLIAREIKTYGVADCVLSIIGESDSWAELCAMEKAAISEYKTKSPFGLNKALGGQGPFGLVRSTEDCEANRKRTTKRMSDPAVRAAVGERSKAMWTNPTIRATILTKMQISKNTPEYKAKRSLLAKTQWIIANGALTISNKAYWEHPETRAAHSTLTKTRLASKEARATHSAMLKIAHNRPEVRAAASAKAIKRFADPEIRQRHGLAVATGYAKKVGRPFSYIYV